MPPVAVTDPTAVVGKRIGAWFLDGVIFVIVFFALSTVLGIGPGTTSVGPDAIRSSLSLAPGADVTSDDATTYCNDWNAAHGGWSSGVCLPDVSGLEAETGAATIVHDFDGLTWLFGALAVVYIVYQGLAGASLGKLAFGLRIVRSDGSRAGVGASAIRTVLWIIDAITCAVPVLGGILILTTRGHRRVGDMAAGTYVVSADRVGLPVTESAWGPPPGHGPVPAGLPGTPVPYGAPPAQPGPPGAPDPWAPAHGVPPTAGQADPVGATGGYEADVAVWDEARGAYILYDSGRAEWLEYDDRRRQWGPISS